MLKTDENLKNLRILDYKGLLEFISFETQMMKTIKVVSALDLSKKRTDYVYRSVKKNFQFF